MCELFGASSQEPVPVNGLLREFFSHSTEHPDGWGMAVFYENAVSMEKEPLSACRSAYLKERLRHTPAVRNMIAHIRKASIGELCYENCHPFVQRDHSDRAWTLAHNGTIFDCPALEPYARTQAGSTDSERILCHLITRINTAQTAIGRSLNADERFKVADRLVCEITPCNKVNLLIYDGELFYVHTNYANSLYIRKTKGSALFATAPLEPNGWRPMAFTTLCAYQGGSERFRGTCHGNEYLDDPEDTKFLYTDFAGL